jgi:hypothetical protein
LKPFLIFQLLRQGHREANPKKNNKICTDPKSFYFTKSADFISTASLILAPIGLANASLACVQVLGFDVSNDVVTGAGTVHLPRGLVFSHLQGKTA